MCDVVASGKKIQGTRSIRRLNICDLCQYYYCSELCVVGLVWFLHRKYQRDKEN